MIPKMHQRAAVVLAPAWPSESGGYGIAIRASLLLYLDYFAAVHFVCISDQPFQDANAWPAGRIEWTHVPIANRPIWVRFLKGLAGTLPAISIRYACARRDVMCAVRSVVRKSTEIPCLIIEDIPTACIMMDIRQEFHQMPVAIRSHDMTEKSYGFHCQIGSQVHRLAWQVETRKIRRLEKTVCEQVDRLWTISREDADEYVKRLSIQPDGVIGVCMDIERYRDVGTADAKTVVNVGTVDVRKGKEFSIS